MAEPATKTSAPAAARPSDSALPTEGAVTSERTDVRRVMLALWETGSLQDLWTAALQHISGGPAELVTVFVRDDRWRRAASLPFTREVPRLGGEARKFTLLRAEQLDREAVAQAEGRVKELASAARIEFSFTVLRTRGAEDR